MAPVNEDAPQLIDTLVETLLILPLEEEEQKDKPFDSDDSVFLKANSEDDSVINNIV